MVVFGSKSSSAKTKLFEQPLDKIFDPKAIKHFNETIAAANSRSPPALCQSLSAPLTSSTLTWAKLSQENSASKRKRAAARLRRFTIDANNNNSSLITSITSAPIISQAATPLCISHRLGTNLSSTPQDLTCNNNTNENSHQSEDKLNEDERCRMLLNVLPEPIRCLLNEIYLRGPSTVGIFRKSPNAKHCKELKQKLESSDFPLNTIEQFQVSVIASVFKEWLRSLPDCLLMSRLYPQWIDVAKLIEPLHLHHQQQQLQQQQSNDHTADVARLASTSSFEDNLNGNLTKSPNGSDCEPTSLRPSAQATSPLTDNGQQQRGQQQQSGNISPATGDVHGQQLSRALSCSIMASDSGHSSFSSSSSSSTSSSFDSCEVVAREARSGKHFQKATTEFQQLASAQSASYLKRKCYQQRQQSQCSIDYGSDRNISQLAGSEDGCSGNMANQSIKTNNSTHNSLSLSEFSMRERRFECIRVVRQLLEALNETNLILLRAIICVLWHIADNSNYNKMSSNNLGVCIGQSLLNDERQHHHLQNRGKKLQSFSLSISSSSNLAGSTQTSEHLKQVSPTNFTKRHRRARSQCLLASTLSLSNLSHLSASSSPTNSTASNGQLTSSISSNYLDSSGAQETAKYVPILVAFMIDNAKELFGSDLMNLFGPGRPQRQPDHEKAGADAIDNNRASSSAQSQQVVKNVSQASSESTCTDSVSISSVAGQTMDDQLTAPTEVKSTQQAVADDHHLLECKSIVVTREQNCSPGNCSDLFVKMDATEHPSVTKPLTSPLSSSPVKQHRRHLSTSVLVHIGSQPFKTCDHVTTSSSESAHGGESLVNNEATKPVTHPEATTTSILIVNTPKKQTDQLAADGAHFELDHNRCCSSSSMLGDQQYSISNDLQLERQQTTPDSRSCGSDKSDCRQPDSLLATSLIVDRIASSVGGDQEPLATTMTAKTTTTTTAEAAAPIRQQQHQRPLSATESTTSSSRASSSTSGVHSESPAFSCEQDSASSSPSAHNCGTRTATTCSSSSRSASISSPTSSAPSTCTSPMDDMDMTVDTVDSSHHNRHHSDHIVQHGRHIGIGAATLSHNEAMRHNLLGQVRLESSSTQQGSSETSTVVPAHEPKISMNRTRVRTDSERPKSMVSLSRPSEMMGQASATVRYQPSEGNSISHGQHYSSAHESDTAKQNEFIMNSQRQHRSQFQSQTLNRRNTPTSGQLVNLNRMPKISFQYTTSCYGGEAVLYYPSNAHLSQQHSMRHQQDQQQQSIFHQQQRTGQYVAPAMQLRGCNRIQSLDRYTQLHHSSSHLRQQPQQPQRSHVMMLRDYYLSLQEQCQKQQQYQEFLKRQQQQQSKQQMLVSGKSQKPTVTNTATIGDHLQAIQQQQQQQPQRQQQQQQYQQSQLMMMQPPVESRRAHNNPAQHQQHPGVTTDPNVMQAGDAPKKCHDGDHELMREQPASAAVAYQRIQPRMARIRPNQFNGLYVKRASSPMRSHEINSGDLVVLDHRNQAAVSGSSGIKPIAPSGGSSLMAISQSSLSQQSSKMSSSSSTAEHSSDEEVCSSDECSASGWMESTMV